MFKTVLFPIDHSRESREAADTVANIVKTYNSRLVILSVVETPPKEDQVSSPEAAAMNSPEAIAVLLENAQKMFEQKNIKAEIIERKGQVAFTICDVADEITADLIIMGCRGMGLNEEHALESITSRVINLCPCPVLIVP